MNIGNVDYHFRDEIEAYYLLSASDAIDFPPMDPHFRLRLQPESDEVPEINSMMRN